jgi:hypothetical protein
VFSLRRNGPGSPLKIAIGFTHKYHANPRLSANQVADYLSANATNRRRILSEAKYPSTMILIRYDEARTAVAAHMAANGGKKNILSDALASLQRKSGKDGLTPYKKQNYKLCADAIEGFQASEAKMGVGSVKFRAPDIHNSTLRISDVIVSVSLDLIVEKTDSKGNTVIGGAVLVFSKSGGPEKNIEARCHAVALLAHEVLKQQLKADQTCDPSLCMAIDVFNGKAYRAKSQQKKLYKTIETSCEEVATVWPVIQPPANYNGPPIPKR